MRFVLSAAGSIALLLAALALLLAVASWPPGGLMFAAPYLFLMLAVALGLIGGLLLFVGRRLRSREGSDGAA
jgi:hypothetical protein